MKVSAVFVCAMAFAAALAVPALAAGLRITPGAGPGRLTNYVGTPAGVVGAASAAGDAGTRNSSSTGAGSALDIPEPAVIALFGLVALVVGRRLRRAKA